MGYNAGTMTNKFERILRLVQRTGDRVVVLEKETDHAYVVMDFDEYEAIFNAHRDSGLSNGQKGGGLGNEAGVIQGQGMDEKKGAKESIDVWDVMQDANDNGQTWDPATLSDEELVDLEQQYQAFANRHVQEAIDETQLSEDSSSGTEIGSDEDDYGEESFYLEPVE